MAAQEESIDVLLNILGNKTRRKIVQLVASEPRYLQQLAREIDVSQQAILKHLSLLEKHSFVTSYEMKSELGAPPRKYYRLKGSMYLTAGIMRGLFRVEVFPVLAATAEREPREISQLHRQIEMLEHIDDPKQRLRLANNLVLQMERKLKQLDEMKVCALRLRQRMQEIVNEVIRAVAESKLEKKVLHTILGSGVPPDVEALSVTLDIRERTVEDVLRELETKKLLPLKKKTDERSQKTIVHRQTE